MGNGKGNSHLGHPGPRTRLATGDTSHRLCLLISCRERIKGEKGIRKTLQTSAKHNITRYFKTRKGEGSNEREGEGHQSSHKAAEQAN